MKKFFIAGVSCLVIALFAVLTMSFKVSQTELCSGCIDFAGNAYDDGDCIASVTLTPSCQFLFTNKEESPYEYIRGTYSIDGSIEKGGQCTIKIYIDGEPTQYGTIMWPIEDNKIFLSLGDYLFY
ncbi:MAG: hypothetical protein IJP65_09835 [Bacteroidales bacterium]|nr:hypothetical protein [Bacteroidales bacterium]